MTETLMNLTVAVGFPLAAIALYIAWRIRRRWYTFFPALFGCFLILIASIALWWTNRPLPVSEERALFEGIEYIRSVRPAFGGAPHVAIIHVVLVDLDAPGLSLFVTPGTPNGEYEQVARTTSEFLDRYNLQVAINGDFFNPFYERGPLDFYPHSGDGINLHGLAISGGERYSNGFATGAFETMYISADNEVTFSAPDFEPFHAISGNWLLVENGVFSTPNELVRDSQIQQPRTAVGLDESGRKLLLLLVDGRQPNYSEGVTVAELADLLIEYGAYTALNFDGGGSVTLVIEGEDGRPQVLNSPIHTRIPGRERPVANHLGVYARRLGG
jgi:hypothetical protein